MTNSSLVTRRSSLPPGIGVVVLAAGRGSRMGERPKLLLPMGDGRSILWHAVQNALAWKPQEVIVVVRPDLLSEMADALTGLPVKLAPNPDYIGGMASSLKRGVSALSDRVKAVLVMLGDEPLISDYIVERLLAAYSAEGKPVTTPLYGAQPGPPTLFARSIFPELLRLEGDAGGRQIILKHPELVCMVPFNEDERPKDVDTPEDYAALLHTDA